MRLDVFSATLAHPSEDLLEEYCFQRVCEPEQSVLEEHLLVCEVCQEAVTRLGEYISLVKTALAAAPSPGPSVIALPDEVPISDKIPIGRRLSNKFPRRSPWGSQFPGVAG
jgi:hypothetical protein